MCVSAAIEKMVEFYQGNLHDIEHFLKVWAFAKTIGEQEGLDRHTQQVLELASVMPRAFFAGLPVSEQDAERISWLAAHHHTYSAVDGPDYQILLEADFLVNAGESGYKTSAVEAARKNFFKTSSGTRLPDKIYLR